MTEQELIAKQALQIANLEQELSEAKAACTEIHMMCVCIGGPLNDNKKGYTRDQMRDFFFIDEHARSVCHELPHPLTSGRHSQRSSVRVLR